MPRKSSELNRSDEYKRMLIAESELNRRLLAQECKAAAAGVGNLARDVKKIGALASSLAILVAGFSTIQKKPRPEPARRLSLFYTLLKGARLGTSLWAAFHRK
jgi:hypothetical protein